MPASERPKSPAAASQPAPTSESQACVICGFTPTRGHALAPVTIGKRKRLACVFHALIADRAAPETMAEYRKLCAEHDRRGKDRRASGDRRAFWRPTPDRRTERTEQGRRQIDADAT